MTKLIITFHLFLVSFWAFFYVNTPEKNASISDITICHSMGEEGVNFSGNNPDDTTKAYSMPLLTQTPKGEVMLSWTEKDAQGMTSFCLAFSKDKGKTFGEKKTIYSGTGLSNSRMMRAKVLAKKDGSFVAIFSNRGEGGGRSSNIVFCVSEDGGSIWTSPVSVDSDPKQGIVRGFFDAIVMSNDEIAVVYLKDVANSTKHEERDLRLVITKNGAFLPERVIDPVVCDCCPINMLIDADGALNIIYRDNNDNIRDMAKILSTDNAATFSKPEILHNDGWKINGCPHSGAVSSIYGKSALIAWFSGAEKESGVQLATREGKKLFVLSDASAKNPCLINSPKSAVLLWEQNTNDNISKIAYRKINDNKVSESIWLDGSSNGTNSVALSIVGGEPHNQILVAYEVKQANKKNTIKITTISL